MRRKVQKFSSFGLIASMSLAGAVVVGPGAHAVAPTQAAGVSTASASASQQGTPADLPVMSIEETKAQAKAQGLDAEATQLAVDLQKMVNRYHQLPEDMKNLPVDDPRVQAELRRAVGNSPSGVVSAMGFTQAMDCAFAIADAASVALPGKNIWTLIKLAGGVITVADVVKDALQAGAEADMKKILRDRLGPEAARQFGKVLGIAGVIDSCSG